MTDGLQTGTARVFDFTQEWTAADAEEFRKMLSGKTPESRVRKMQTQLGALGVNVAAPIKLHADAIRAILADLPPAPTGRQVDRLDEADHLWQKILVLRDVVPKAVLGVKHSEAQRKRRADKPAADYLDPDRNARLRIFHARLMAADARDATAQTAVEFDLSSRQVRRILKGKRTHPG